MKQQFCKLSSVTLIVAVFGSVLSATAGSLTPPPGPIQPTNRVQINQQFDGLPITIAEPGSYVLTGNIVAPAGYTGNGIAIFVGNVTLDLNSFSVIGVAGSGSGIAGFLVGGGTITVRNGSVRGWGDTGVTISTPSDHLCDNLRVTDNGRNGIQLSNGGNITRCVASNNTEDGIIGTGLISHCTVEGNGENGIRVPGSGLGALVVSCFANDNALSGILGVGDGDVIDCHARGNGVFGIVLSSGGIAIGNTCKLNGTGIGITSNSQVEGNHLLENLQDGIVVVGTGNTIVKNVVSGSTNNYVIPVGNDVGPISTAATATSPWANITD